MSMTDQELNALFAEKVCGWSFGDDGYGYETVYREKVAPYKTVGPVHKYPFTHSLDAVLPWLEKSAFDVQITYSNTCMLWTVTLQGRFTSNCEYRGEANGADGEQLPRAIVLALLKAHGVEVKL